MQNSIALPVTGVVSGLENNQKANQALEAIATCFLGSVAPDPSYAGQWWADTGTTIDATGGPWLRQRNSANSGWLRRFRADLDFVNSLGSVQLPAGAGIVFEGATDDGFETTLGCVDPTADRNPLLPDESGILALIGVKNQIGYWPAAAIKPQTTNGCAALAWDESTTNKVLTGHLAFDKDAIEYAQFSFRAPAALDESANFIALFEWYEAAGASSHDCVWQIEMQAQSDADTIDSAWGTAVTVTDTGTSGTRRMTAQTAAVTPGGAWAAGDEIIVRISRKATDGADTLNVDAKLCGVALFATYAVSTEA